MSINSLVTKLEKIHNLQSNPTTYLSKRLLDYTKKVLVDRIFGQGLNSSLASIGQYSTSPFTIYQKGISQNEFRSEFGYTKYKDDQVFFALAKSSTAKTARVKGGTKQLRELQNLQTSYVDLVYTGDLMNSIQVKAQGNVISIFIGDDENINKMSWLENHFGSSIFALNISEIQDIKAETARNIHLFVQQVLQ